MPRKQLPPEMRQRLNAALAAIATHLSQAMPKLQVDVPFTSILDPLPRAPKEGIQIDGKFYRSGQFIPHKEQRERVVKSLEEAAAEKTQAVRQDPVQVPPEKVAGVPGRDDSDNRERLRELVREVRVSAPPVSAPAPVPSTPTRASPPATPTATDLAGLRRPPTLTEQSQRAVMPSREQIRELVREVRVGEKPPAGSGVSVTPAWTAVPYSRDAQSRPIPTRSPSVASSVPPPSTDNQRIRELTDAWLEFSKTIQAARTGVAPADESAKDKFPRAGTTAGQESNRPVSVSSKPDLFGATLRLMQAVPGMQGGVVLRDLEKLRNLKGAWGDFQQEFAKSRGASTVESLRSRAGPFPATPTGSQTGLPPVAPSQAEPPATPPVGLQTVPAMSISHAKPAWTQATPPGSIQAPLSPPKPDLFGATLRLMQAVPGMQGGVVLRDLEKLRNLKGAWGDFQQEFAKSRTGGSTEAKASPITPKPANIWNWFTSLWGGKSTSPDSTVSIPPAGAGSNPAVSGLTLPSNRVFPSAPPVGGPLGGVSSDSGQVVSLLQDILRELRAQRTATEKFSQGGEDELAENLGGPGAMPTGRKSMWGSSQESPPPTGKSGGNVDPEPGKSNAMETLEMLKTVGQLLA